MLAFYANFSHMCEHLDFILKEIIDFSLAHYRWD